MTQEEKIISKQRVEFMRLLFKHRKKNFKVIKSFIALKVLEKVDPALWGPQLTEYLKNKIQVNFTGVEELAYFKIFNKLTKKAWSFEQTKANTQKNKLKFLTYIPSEDELLEFYRLSFMANPLEEISEEFFLKDGARVSKQVDSFIEKNRQVMSPAELASELEDELKVSDLKTRRKVSVVARTEALTISSEVRDFVAKKNEVSKKTWRTSIDGRERPQHAAANGQKKNKDENFKVGGESLQFPRDRKASAGNRINCRCIVLYDY